MFGIGTTELVIILAIILIIFGVGKLPDIGSGLGKAIRNFKKTVSEPEIDISLEDGKQKFCSSAKGIEK
jgi:sec-independent protein translocase protein TatA